MSTIKEIDGKPIRWQSQDGAVHSVEGTDVHPGVRLLWTLCQRDVPAGKAFTTPEPESVTCPECLARMALGGAA